MSPLRTALLALLALSLTLWGFGCGGGLANSGINPANFVTGVDHEFFPLRAGTTFVYETGTAQGRERREMVVTPQTRTILGVACTEVRNTVTLKGRVVETSFDWYAQHRDGAVWAFGRDCKQSGPGRVTGAAGSWQGGVGGGKPGIIMQARPLVGDTHTRQIASGGVETTVAVVSLIAATTVPGGAFTDCVKTQETSSLDPGVVTSRFYAKGVGCVKDAAAGLVSVTPAP